MIPAADRRIAPVFEHENLCAILVRRPPFIAQLLLAVAISIFESMT
jgi:hypothetical protein